MVISAAGHESKDTHVCALGTSGRHHLVVNCGCWKMVRGCFKMLSLLFCCFKMVKLNAPGSSRPRLRLRYQELRSMIATPHLLLFSHKLISEFLSFSPALFNHLSICQFVPFICSPSPSQFTNSSRPSLLHLSNRLL